MAWFKVDDEEGYESMLRERATPWGQDPKLQPMSRSVDHTISMMIYAMEVETAGTDNLQLTEQETAAWVKEKKLHDKVEYATRQMS